MDFEALLVHINERLHRSFVRLNEEAVRRSAHAGLTIAQLSYLMTIHRLHRPTLSGLAEELGITKASASTTVHKLIHKGLVKAQRAREDHRVIHLWLTANGRKVIDAQARVFREFSAQIRASLTEKEIPLLQEALEKLAQSL